MVRFLKGLKKNKKISKSVRRVGLILFLLALTLSLGQIQGTNSFFTDSATVSGNTVSAGYWIPVLTMSIDPAAPDGNNGWYRTSPCVTLEAELGGAPASPSEITIYYEFSNDGDPISGGTVYPGVCVSVPDGNPTHFQAQAVNNANLDWRSNIESGQFKIDTKCPFARITNPGSGDTLSGTVAVSGTVTDANPHHYWLVVEDSGGNKVAGPGVVNDTNSFTDKKFFDWDTTGVADGSYRIKLEARDQAGNKCPNQAPVPNDPGISASCGTSPHEKLTLSRFSPQRL